MTDIDPFKILGAPSTWGTFGDGEADAACDAERRAMCDHFLRRLRKAEKRGGNAAAHILAGGSTAFAGLFISAAGGPDNLPDDAFDHWIAMMTFAWYSALGVNTEGGFQ